MHALTSLCIEAPTLVGSLQLGTCQKPDAAAATQGWSFSSLMPNGMRFTAVTQAFAA